MRAVMYVFCRQEIDHHCGMAFLNARKRGMYLRKICKNVPDNEKKLLTTIVVYANIERLMDLDLRV